MHRNKSLLLWTSVVASDLPTRISTMMKRHFPGAGVGRMVLLGYLSRSERAACTLVEMLAVVKVPTNEFYLASSKSYLRHQRVSLARDVLVSALNAGT
jgi:hypothetical protein